MDHSDTELVRSIADDVRLESARAIASLSALERIALALRLGDEDVALYRAAHGVSHSDAPHVGTRARGGPDVFVRERSRTAVTLLERVATLLDQRASVMRWSAPQHSPFMESATIEQLLALDSSPETVPTVDERLTFLPARSRELWESLRPRA